MNITCPKCGSDQITAEKKGFSAGKAVAGAVLTGGVGLLAGFHGSNNIEVHCLACGNHWNPQTYAKEKSREVQQKQYKDLSKWRRALYAAYESGDHQTAEKIYLQRQKFNSVLPNIEATYKHFKKSDRQLNGLVAAFVATVVIIIWFILK